MSSYNTGSSVPDSTTGEIVDDTPRVIAGLLAYHAAVMQSYDQLAQRRQNMNTLYVGVNVVALSGLGLLLTSGRMNSWWTLGLVVALALGTTPINLLWMRAQRQFELTLSAYFTYLIAAEKALGDYLPHVGNLPLGIFRHLEAAVGNRRFIARQREYYLAIYFIALFFLVAACSAVLVVLVQQRILSTPG